MKKTSKARIVTVAVLTAALAIVLSRRIPHQASAESGPQDAIYAMLDAARTGDVSGYLSAYTGQIAASLKQAVSESTESAFSTYLRESNSAVKGIALHEPVTLTDREVKIRAEYVYADRNEVQFFYMERTGGGWKIARVDAAERIKTLVPYGTPVR